MSYVARWQDRRREALMLADLNLMLARGHRNRGRDNSAAVDSAVRQLNVASHRPPASETNGDNA